VRPRWSPRPCIAPTESLERVDDWGEPPGLPLVSACWFQTRQPCGGVGDRADVCLAHALLGRGGPDDLAEPPEVSGTPGSPARRTDSVPPEKGFEPKLCGLPITDGLCTRPAQVLLRCILHLYGRQSHRLRRTPPRVTGSPLAFFTIPWRNCVVIWCTSLRSTSSSWAIYSLDRCSP
jgi:hypothetical protein